MGKDWRGWGGAGFLLCFGFSVLTEQLPATNEQRGARPLSNDYKGISVLLYVLSWSPFPLSSLKLLKFRHAIVSYQRHRSDLDPTTTRGYQTFRRDLPRQDEGQLGSPRAPYFGTLVIR